MEELLSINLKPSTRRTAVAILEMYAKYYSKVDIDKLAEFLDEIKSEARKEFAERLKKNLHGYSDSAFTIVTVFREINDLLKEMERDGQ